jgi:hypothetical protein
VDAEISVRSSAEVIRNDAGGAGRGRGAGEAFINDDIV